MAYQTPAERRARAQENISSENGISLLGAYNTARVAKQEAQREAEREQELAKLDEVRTNPIVRALASLGDLSLDIAAGTGRWLEGLIDFTASTNGWMFGKNIREKTKEFVAKDLTAMWHDTVEGWHDDSYFKTGGIVEQVGQGVGQILPAVIIGVVTGGAGAAASAAGQAVSTAAMAASAAGNATGEAWKEGAGYGQGLAYGAATGAVEALTERMTGGASKAVYGAGFLDNIIGKAGKSAAGKFAGNVAETGIKRIAKNMVEEAVEEGVAELANPALKSIYKGKEAFSEYTEGEYWKGVGQAALVGGLTAGVFGETIGRSTAVASGGKAGDISNAVEELGAIKTKAQNLQARGQLDPNDPSLLQAKKKNYQIIENTLQKATPKQREKLINRFGLNKDFDSNGEMNATLKQRLGLVQATEQGSSTPSSALTSDQKRYVSYTAWEDGERIKEDLSAMRDQLEEKGIEVDSVEINDTPLTEQQEKNFQYYTKAVNKFGEVSGLDLDFVVVKPAEGVNAGIIKGTNTFYISADSLKNEQWMKDFVHETLHTTEGTEGWRKLVKYMTEELGLDEKAEEEAIERGYDTENETEMVTEMASIEAEYALGNEEFIKRFVGSDKKGFARLFERIHELVKVFKQIKTPEGKKQYEQLKKATKLYIKAAQESGDIRLLHMLGAIENDEEVDIESLDMDAYWNERSGIQLSKKFAEFSLKDRKLLQEYADYTPNSLIVSKLQEYRDTGSLDFFRYEISKVSDRAVEDIKKLIGDDVIGYSHNLNSEGVKHTENRHGINGEHDHTMKNPDDFGRMEFILDNYDYVDFVYKNGKKKFAEGYRGSNNKPAPLLAFAKKINGTYYVIEAVCENKHKKLWVVSAYTNKTGITQVSESNNVSNQTTPEAMLASLPVSNESISQEEADVKRKKNKGQFSLKPTQLRSAYTPKSQVQFNLAYVEQHKADLRKAYSNEAAISYSTLIERYDAIEKIWRELGGELNSDFLDEWNKRTGSDKAFEVFKEQSGYEYNIELSTMCKKGVPLFEAIDTIVRKEVMKRLDTKVLTKESKQILYDILKANGYEIPCQICYVEQARQKEGDIINKFLNGDKAPSKKSYKMGWNVVLKRVESLMKENGVEYHFPTVDRSLADDTYAKKSLNMTVEEQKAFYNALATIANEEVKRINTVEKTKEGDLKRWDFVMPDKLEDMPQAVEDFFEIRQEIVGDDKKKNSINTNLKLLKVLFTDPDSRFYVDEDMLYSSQATRNLSVWHNGMYKVFNSQGGVGGYKLKQTPIIYWGEILAMDADGNKIRLGGGIRNQSNSDFQVYTLMDQMQIYADLTAKGYYLHAYTKVPAELKIFGLSGAKINASLIPAVIEIYKRDANGNVLKDKSGEPIVDQEATKAMIGFDKEGNLLFDGLEGINPDEAFMLIEDPEYSKNITGICIGYSDRHIQALLDDKRIQLIIGFHDKTNDWRKRYRGARWAHNYKGENEAYDLKKKETVHLQFSKFLQQAEEMFDFDAKTETFTGETDFNGKHYTANDIPKLAADIYLKYCSDNNYAPAYSGRGRDGAIDFSKHENYYKLLGDFGLYDSQGNYAPHRKVNLNVPKEVPVLKRDSKGNLSKEYWSTKDYIKKELKGELEVRDNLARDLADESEDGIIPTFIREHNEQIKPKKTTRKAQMSLMPKYEYRNGKQLELNAELNKTKAYSRKDASELLNSILDEYLSFGETYGELRGKSRSAVIDAMWQNFNSNDKNRNKTARDIAEYIVEQAILEDPAMDEIKAMHMETLDILRDYRKSIDLKSIKGDIKSRFGNDNSPFNRWGARKTTKGIDLQNLKTELEGRGIRIVAENSADIFFAIDDMYTQSLKIVKERKKKIAEDLTEGEVSQLKSDLAQAVLNSYYDGGHIGKVRQIINDYRTKIRDLSRRLTVKNRLASVAQDIKNWKKGTFVNASTYKTDIFKDSLYPLGNLNYQGNLNEGGFRRIIGDLRAWYDMKNPIFKNQVNEVGEGGFVPITAYNQEVADALEAIANGKGDITIEEMQSAEAVLRYFKRFMEHYNKVVRNGKLVEAKPIAEEAIEDSKKNARNQDTVIARVLDTFRDAFVDPMTIMRRMDGYKEGGFFTTTLNELRYGLIATKGMQRKLLNPLADFYDKHKDFQKTIQNKTVTYNGQQLPAAIAMQLYMTLHRDQALRGLALNGFEYKQGKKAVATKVDGFAKGQIFDPSDVDAELKVLAKEQIDALASQFTALEMEYIHTVEQAYEECKDIKRETDMNRMGYTNVIDGYYVPIRRAIGKPLNLEQSWMEDANSAGNPSFNKDTVKGAAGALYIDAVDVVVDKHITAMSMYANLTTAIDNYNTLVNLDISGNPNDPVSLRKSLPQVWANGFKYMNNLMKDVQGVGGESSIFNSLYGELRGAWATAQLAANPKVWVTQLSSIPAAISILKPTSIFKSVGVSGKDVDQYCELAAIRNDENTAAMAQGVFDKSKNPSVLKRIGEWLMKPIGKVDRWVIERHFAACQVEIAETKGLAIGTEANKIEAGKLLTKVILETQQNSLATERSAAMRSKSETARTLTMFTSDAMKVVGRVMDSVGEWAYIKKSIRNTTDANEIASLNKKLAEAGKKVARSSAALASTSVFMALVAQAFRWLRAQDDDDENIAMNMTLDAIGNMLGGLPIIKDIYGFFVNGYELEGFNYSTINDMLSSVKSCFTSIEEAFSGDTSKMPLAIKNMFVALGNMLGLPVRNVYNYVTGITKRISPSAGYKIDDFFYNKSYRSDLEKAVNKGDEKMIATITSLMLDENVGGIDDKATRQAMNDLIIKGYNVIPNGVPDTFTYEEVEYKLTKTQKKTWERIYNGANEVVADMVALATFENATDDVKARAINFVYQTYRNLAIQEVLGEDLETKNILFAEAIPVEKLALIVATANTIEADKDKNGNSISGTKKAKIQAMVSKLKMTAAEKYMIMGYLGYTNANGETQVKQYINRLKLTDSEKEKLLQFSGYKIS